MIEFPVIQEIIAETKQKDLLKVLKGRFGLLPSEMVAAIKGVSDEAKLDDLLEYAGVCPELDAFRARMQT